MSSTSSVAPQPSGQGAAAGSVASERSSEERVYIIVIDLLSFRAGATERITSAVRGFVEKLQPADLVGLAAFPAGPEIDASTNHTLVISALDKVVGAGEPAV